MSKPNDISEELHLRAAETVVLFPHPFKSVAATGKAITLVARAIMAAEQRGEERERVACSVIAGALAEKSDAAEPRDDFVRGFRHAARAIAKRILKRGEASMFKPTDIPQDVWNAVTSILGHPGVLVSAGCYERIATQSARALMSAEKQGQEHERAACALSAAALAAKHEDTGAGDDFDMGYRHAARVVADAIRKRGEG